MRYFHNSVLYIYFGRARLTVKTRLIYQIASLPKIEVYRILSEKLLPFLSSYGEENRQNDKQN